MRVNIQITMDVTDHETMEDIETALGIMLAYMGDNVEIASW